MMKEAMMKEVLIGVGGVVVGAVVAAAIFALIKYIKRQKTTGAKKERAYFDELGFREIKKWFSDRIDTGDKKGLLLYPTEENLKKWNMKLDDADHVIIQLVYQQNPDETREMVSYREIAYGRLNPKVKEVLDDNGGAIVLEK